SDFTFASFPLPPPLPPIATLFPYTTLFRSLAAFQSPAMPELMSSLPIYAVDGTLHTRSFLSEVAGRAHIKTGSLDGVKTMAGYVDRKSTRLNSSHEWISYAVFCLKKKKKTQ